MVSAATKQNKQYSGKTNISREKRKLLDPNKNEINEGINRYSVQMS